MPGMPSGKPPGVRCAQLDAANLCRLFGKPERPGFCLGLRPSQEMCGIDAADALSRLAALETDTLPDTTYRNKGIG